jgi:hypothetical protein
MSKTRYKIRKEQLERVVESFVMESAKGGSMVDKNAAKKHKMSMGAEQHDDMGEGMEKAKEVKKAKMKQAPEVKKNIHGKVSETRMRELNKLMETYDITEDELKEFFGGNSKKINKAIEDFKATYANELGSIQKAYKARSEEYMNLSKKLSDKAGSVEFLMDLVKKHGIKGIDEKRPMMDSDFVTLRKGILELTQPMDLMTFKKQLEKGGWGLSDLGGRDLTGGR